MSLHLRLRRDYCVTVQFLNRLVARRRGRFSDMAPRRHQDQHANDKRRATSKDVGSQACNS